MLVLESPLLVLRRRKALFEERFVFEDRPAGLLDPVTVVHCTTNWIRLALISSLLKARMVLLSGCQENNGLYWE